MILQKKYFDELKIYLGEEAEEEHANALLKQIDDELLYETIRCFERKKKDELKQYLLIGDRYRNLFSDFIEEKKKKKYFSLALLIGEFNGIIKTLEKLLSFLFGKDENRQTLTGLCASRNYIKEILLLIYRNPDIRHKDLSDKIGIRKTYLNELIKLLEPTGSINKYAYGKCTYYELMLEGRRYVEEYLKDSEADKRETFLNKNSDSPIYQSKLHVLPRLKTKTGLENTKERSELGSKIFGCYFIKTDDKIKMWG